MTRSPNRAPRFAGKWAALLGLLQWGCGKACPAGAKEHLDLCISLQSADASRDAGSNPTDAPGPDGPASCADGGGPCNPVNLYVDSVRGNDDNPGDEFSPFRTFKKAISLAVAGQTVNFEAGTYATSLGDDFSQEIPDRVSLQARPGTSSGVTFRAHENAELKFAGSGSLRGIRLENFGRSLKAKTGDQLIEGVTISAPNNHVLVEGDAHLRCSSCSIVDVPENAAELILVSDDATLELQNSVIDVGTNTGYVYLIYLLDSANLSLDEVELKGDYDYGIVIGNKGFVRIADSIFRQSAGMAIECAGASSSARLNWTRSTFHANVGACGGFAEFKVRSCNFFGDRALSIGPESGAYDFGVPPGPNTKADPGNNVFGTATSKVRLEANLFYGTVLASGNVWLANAQGADAQGHYPVGMTVSVTPGERIEGPNFSLEQMLKDSGSRSEAKSEIRF